MPDEVKRERLARLSALVEAQRHTFNRRMVGSTLPVLIEKPARHMGQLAGKTPYLQPVHVTGDPALIGTVRQVSIEHYSGNSLFGRILADQDLSMERR